MLPCSPDLVSQAAGPGFSTSADTVNPSVKPQTTPGHICAVPCPQHHPGTLLLMVPPWELLQGTALPWSHLPHTTLTWPISPLPKGENKLSKQLQLTSVQMSKTGQKKSLKNAVCSAGGGKACCWQGNGQGEPWYLHTTHCTQEMPKHSLQQAVTLEMFVRVISSSTNFYNLQIYFYYIKSINFVLNFGIRDLMSGLQTDFSIQAVKIN